MKNEPTDLAAERTGPVAYRPGDDAKQSWKEQSESRPVRQGVQDEPLPPNIVMFHAHGEF